MNPKAPVKSKRLRAWPSAAPTLALAVAAVSIHLSPPSSLAVAVTTNWINDAGGSFTTATNWDNGVPDGDDTAVFNRGFLAYTVTLPGYILDPSPGNHVINYLRVNTNEVALVNSPSVIYKGPRGLTVANPDISIVIGENNGDTAILDTTLNNLTGANTDIARAANAVGTLNISSGVFSMTNAITVGNGGVGRMTIQGGADVSDASGYIGLAQGSLGIATVRGVGSTWTNQTLQVGQNGYGTLDIEDGGRVTSNQSKVSNFGTVNISGVGSSFDHTGTLTIDQQSSLNISSGGRVNAAKSVINSGASATVTGPGSAWVNSSTVEVNANAKLTVSNGGRVSDRDGFMFSSSTVNVSGAGSIWNHSGALTMNVGSLTIADGGLVNDASSVIQSGSVTVTGPDSKWLNSGDMEIGVSDVGSLVISDGALASSSSAQIGSRFFGTGVVRVVGAGSTWTNSGDVTIGSSSTDGFVTVSQGGAVSVGGLMLIDHGVIGGDGTFAADVINLGTVSPGFSPNSNSNTLQVNGSFHQFGSAFLRVTLMGTGSSAYSRLQVNGPVELNGKLIVDLFNFEPSAGNSFDILDWGSLSGSFSSMQLPALSTGLSWNTSALYTTGVISVVQTPAQWNVDGNGSWGSAGNWNPQIIPNDATAVANFLGKITAPRTVGLDGSKRVQQIVFDNTNSYTIAPGLGGTLTIGNGTTGSITVASGAHSISAPIAFAGTITKSGQGALTISGPQNHPSGANFLVSSGRVNLNSNASANLALEIHDSGQVVLGADQDLRELIMTVSEPGPQQLDLNSPLTASAFRSLRIHSANLGGAKSALAALIGNARVNPADGIFDSGLAAHPSSALGLAEIGDSILIRPTRIGDLNLDGQVSISDFIDLASHFNSTGTWQEGDLNYDGQVTISDFIDLASNFNSSYAGEVWPISAADQQALSDFAVSVPEANVIFAVLVISSAAMARRKRLN